ncbi:MAG: DUF4956 domain-containing protein [Planctomycetota bacterium]
MDTMNDLLTGLGDEFTRISFGRLLVNVILTMIMGQLLAWHYLRFAQVLSNKRKFSRIFVLVATATLLVITIVGSSLALSLGLVGALSIVRFRTPIKEPEELAYLILAIGAGIGMGANERAITLVVFAVILLYMTIRHYTRLSKSPLRTVVQVSVPISGDPGETANGQPQLQALLPAVEAACEKVDLRRVDCHQDEFNASLLVELKDTKAIGRLLEGVQKALPGVAISLVERDGLD